ncbi:MAG TPA: hypothetical protein VF909_11290, partial [Roseiflexaceae bacterium]
MVLTALLLGLVGVACVSQLALRLLTPYGAIYPHSLLAMYAADYHPWTRGDAPALPPLNPQAALAAERDLLGNGAPGVVPVAVLPPLTPTDTPSAPLQPTATAPLTVTTAATHETGTA